MFPNKTNNITEYLQIKLTKKRNFMIDMKYKLIIKQYKLKVNKENNIIDKKSNRSLLKIIYPNIKIENIIFKNNCKFDLRNLNIEIKK